MIGCPSVPQNGTKTAVNYCNLTSLAAGVSVPCLLLIFSLSIR
ncbi:hypothetical protein HMPREF1557_01557 [Streptococcus sobrinus W1703]|uniref:Uncharacterized protein n=1 Tax=Streptococcus sobrinus W1703 TaxID=1227275 RepID=U2J3G9_9STRE|nr:hypothetical protein HMPREF1557_01557 [Streptococcus sobrinus W1703]